MNDLDLKKKDQKEKLKKMKHQFKNINNTLNQFENIDLKY